MKNVHHNFNIKLKLLVFEIYNEQINDLIYTAAKSGNLIAGSNNYLMFKYYFNLIKNNNSNSNLKEVLFEESCNCNTFIW